MNAEPSAVRYRGMFLTFLFAINLINYTDRMVISGLLEPIGRGFAPNRHATWLRSTGISYPIFVSAAVRWMDR